MLRTIFDDLYNINREMGRIFGDYSYRNDHWAKTNIYENNDGYVIVSKVPGMAKEEADISVKDNILKLTGERKKDDDKKLTRLLNERFGGRFERNFILNEKVDLNNISAEMKNGLLMIKIAKSPESKPKKIEIK